MATRLPRVKSPAWLTKRSAASMKNGSFPLDRILRASLFYPTSGLDGDPVRYLSRSVQSFVYAATDAHFLLYGGYGKQDEYGWSCWPGYPERIRFIEKSGGGSVGMWSLVPD